MLVSNFQIIRSVNWKGTKIIFEMKNYKIDIWNEKQTKSDYKIRQLFTNMKRHGRNRLNIAFRVRTNIKWNVQNSQNWRKEYKRSNINCEIQMHLMTTYAPGSVKPTEQHAVFSEQIRHEIDDIFILWQQYWAFIIKTNKCYSSSKHQIWVDPHMPTFDPINYVLFVSRFRNRLQFLQRICFYGIKLSKSVPRSGNCKCENRKKSARPKSG